MTMAIGEKELAKGELRKLNAIPKSLGDKIADPAFEKWLKQHASTKKVEIVDPVAQKIEQALAGLENGKSVKLGNLGYSVRRAKGNPA